MVLTLSQHIGLLLAFSIEVNFLFFLVKCIYQRLLIKCQEMQFNWVNHVAGKIWMEQIIWCHLFNKILPPFSIYELFMNRLVFLLGIFQKQQVNDINDHIHWEGDIIQKIFLTPASDTYYSLPSLCAKVQHRALASVKSCLQLQNTKFKCAILNFTSVRLDTEFTSSWIH